MRKILIGFVLVALIALASYLRFHHTKAPREVVYGGNRKVTLWSTTAQVRSVAATASFGEPLDVLNRFGDQVEVRTAAGAVGWADERDLLSGEFWQKSKELNATVSALPVEAHGHTRVLSNLHLDPGRDEPRIRQLNKDVPLDIYRRKVGDVPSPSSKAGPQEGATSDVSESKREDWWLVRAHLPDQTFMSGWMLGRFIDLDVPEPLPDYASSAGMRIVAWFELNRVADPAGSTKPQYLVLGDRGSEGQPCDFTLMRVFTWSTVRQRYETAFIESDVCGKLPIKLTAATIPGGDSEFSFENEAGGAPENRLYKMHQTIVRRIGEKKAGKAPAPRRKKSH